MPEIMDHTMDSTGPIQFKYLMFGKSKSSDVYTWLFVIDIKKKIKDVVEIWYRIYGQTFPQ